MKKVALITGASSGIGKTTALQLLRDGYTVYGAARRIDKMADLKSQGAQPISIDVTDELSVAEGVQRIIAQEGRIDVLVNNAGFGLYGSVEETSIEDAKYQFDVNLFGVARLTRAVLPQMRKQKSGTIVNISSMGGKIYTPLGAWYHATKHAIEGWSDCLRLELAEFGIRVVIIEPGVIQTAFGDVMTKPMLDRSGNGPYGPLCRTVAKVTTASYEDGGASPPELIAKTISRAVKSPRPRTRYATGKLAKPLIFVRKWLGDRIYDKAVMSQMK